MEPFLGSGTVLFNIEPRRALVSDTNKHIILFYKQIQDGTINSDTVRTFLEAEGNALLRDGQNHYYRVRDRFNETHDPLDFLFLNRSCFNGLMRFNGKGRFNTPFCRKPQRFSAAYVTKICNQVDWASRTMAAKDWEFVCADWRATLSETKEDDFLYADPPYAGRFTDYYNGWHDNDAAMLEDRLKTLPCPYLYSMWAENQYRRNDGLFRTFSDKTIKIHEHFYHLGSTESLRNTMKEALVIG